MRVAVSGNESGAEGKKGRDTSSTSPGPGSSAASFVASDPGSREIGESLRKSVRAIVGRGSEKRKLKPRESIVGCVTAGLFLPEPPLASFLFFLPEPTRPRA